jgi:hypothetical protein
MKKICLRNFRDLRVGVQFCPLEIFIGQISAQIVDVELHHEIDEDQVNLTWISFIPKKYSSLR